MFATLLDVPTLKEPQGGRTLTCQSEPVRYMKVYRCHLYLFQGPAMGLLSVAQLPAILDFIPSTRTEAHQETILLISVMSHKGTVLLIKLQRDVYLRIQAM